MFPLFSGGTRLVDRLPVGPAAQVAQPPCGDSFDGQRVPLHPGNDKAENALQRGFPQEDSPEADLPTRPGARALLPLSLTVDASGTRVGGIGILATGRRHRVSWSDAVATKETQWRFLGAQQKTRQERFLPGSLAPGIPLPLGKGSEPLYRTWLSVISVESGPPHRMKWSWSI